MPQDNEKHSMHDNCSSHLFLMEGRNVRILKVQRLEIDINVTVQLPGNVLQSHIGHMRG